MRKIANIPGAKEYVRERSDLLQMITDDIGDDYDWKEESNGTYVCCSPFRDESKPSFKVSGNRFKDWGGEQYSGDIFAWAQLWHNLQFVESIQYVATRFNIDISGFCKDATPEEKQKDRYFRLNNAAAEFMHQLLRENINVRDDYLSRSGFTLDQIEPYQVGYCNDKDYLVAHLSQNYGLTQEETSKLEFYRKDLFNNAIVYPIHDHTKNVVGFYARQLNNKEAPYMGNKSDHPLHDSSILYGMHVARQTIRPSGGRLVIVEGFRDAIALKAAGCRGSSLSKQQIEDNLKQYKLNQIVICYDGDQTGHLKTLDLVNKPHSINDATILIARPDANKDPHDVWREGGDEAVEQMLSRLELPIEYYVRTKFNDIDNLSYSDKEILLRDLNDFLKGVNGIQLELAADYVAKLMNASKEAIMDHVAEIKAGHSELHNTEAERSLIAYCMENPAALAACKSAGVQHQAFTISNYQKLFNACIAASERFSDSYTPQSVLDIAMAKAPIPSLPTTVGQVLDGPPHKYTDTAACDIVLDMWRRRSASEQASTLITAARDLSKSFVEVVETHRKHLISTTSSIRPQARTPQELARQFYDEIKRRSQLGGNMILGHSFHHMPSVDLILGGIQKHYTVIAGDSGSGKSIFGMNILKCLAIDSGVKVLWVGQEMHSIDNTMRLASIMTGIDNVKIQTASLTQQEAKKVHDAQEIIANSGYYMAKPVSGHIDEIISIVDEYRWKYGIEAVIWDYIQLITTAPGQEGFSRENIIGHASKMIINKIVGDMGLAGIIIAQMNRDKLASGQHKIAGSYQIVQDCDNFVFIEKKSKKKIEEEGKKKGNRKVIIGKRRGGVSDFQVNAQIHIEPGDASLLLSECTTPTDWGKLHSSVAA